MSTASINRLYRAMGTTVQADIAKRLGVNRSAITNWKLRGVSKSAALKVEELTGVSASYILNGGEFKGGCDDLADAPDTADATDVANVGDVIELDVFDMYAIARKSERTGTQQVVKRSNYSDSSFIVYIDSDSMSPIYNKDDIIIVDTARVAKTGDDVIALNSNAGRAMLRRVRFDMYDNKEGATYNELIALNDFYPALDSRSMRFEIIGVVVEHIRILNS